MNTQLQVIDHSLPLGNLDAYIARVNQIPLLSAEQELELAKRFYEQQDLDAARQLVLAHLRFVVKIARNYLGYGLAHNDLIQEGNVGLMKAVKRFDPNMGVRLVSFAVHWIKAEIHEFIIRNWRIVKIATTKAQRKLFFNLRQMKQRLGWFSQAEVQEVAQDLGVSSHEVLEMEARMAAYDASLDTSAHDDDDHDFFTPAAYLTSPESVAHTVEENNWSEQYQQKLSLALEQLDERSQDILHQRWIQEPKATLHDLAVQYKVSAERIRQLEQQAINKLKNYIEQ